MMNVRARHAAPSPLLARMAALGAVDPASQALLSVAITRSLPLRARRELQAEGRALGEPRAIASGWAARVRLLLDGRRQFVSFLLPGDLLGVRSQPGPIAVSTVVALTEVAMAPLPDPAGHPALADAYAISGALDEAYLVAQITRLGRLNAQERIGDLMLELHERLARAGLADHGSFAMPLTQETLADALGLTPVHVNRMIQLARREGDLEWRGGRVTLLDPPLLAQKVGRVPPRVSTMLPAGH